jgi:hypothetical protein
MNRTCLNANLFPSYLDWTESTCYYVAAIHGVSRAFLAGPYRTFAEAEAALPHSRRWALKTSGDAAAASYDYRVQAMHTGHDRSILGELAPAAGTLARFDDYEIHPCTRTEEPDSPGHFYFEQCEPAEADVWTLYGHIPGQGVEAIGDFDTREHAEEVFARITGRPYPYSG